jgi:hypothetical protein
MGLLNKKYDVYRGKEKVIPPAKTWLDPSRAQLLAPKKAAHWMARCPQSRASRLVDFTPNTLQTTHHRQIYGLARQRGRQGLPHASAKAPASLLYNGEPK